MAYNYMTQYNSPSFTISRGGKKIEFIIIHWWDDPSRNPSFEGVINTLTNPARQASAHFVATGTNRRVACLVDLPNTAWHAGNFDANQRSIGIECDPRCRDEDYDVVSELVCELRAIYGNLPLRRHSEFSPTQCPGNYDLSRIDRESKNKVYNGTFGKTINKTITPVTLPVPNAIKLAKPLVYIMNLPKVQLWDLTSNPNYKSVKEFSKGEEFEAYAEIPFNNTKYLITKYSFEKGIKSGINIGDAILKPADKDKEIADKEIANLKKKIADLEKGTADLEKGTANLEKKIKDLEKQGTFVKVSDLYIKK